MEYTRILFGDDGRAKLLRGASVLADAMRVTLGPQARSVVVTHPWGTPIVVDDGVTIAKEVHLQDEEEEAGVRLLRSVAQKMGDDVGDGTTTAAILAHALIAEGFRNVIAGTSANDIHRGLRRGMGVAVQTIRDLSREVTTTSEHRQIAAISAHGDEEIGQLVADAIDKVGTDGVVTVEESQTIESSLEVVEGMRIDRGFISPYFVTNVENATAELTDCRILLTDARVTHLGDLLELLGQLAEAGSSLLIVAENVEGDALATLVVNRLRGVLRCAAVKAPAFGDRRKATLQDIAILTGGQVISEELGLKLERATLDSLGRADRVIVRQSDTTIVGGKGDRGAIDGRLAELRHQLEVTESEYDREKLRERIARLCGGVAIIRAGASSEIELKRRKEALEDAIAATQAAAAEGIVPGGGFALLRACDAVAAAQTEATDGERVGMRVLMRALEMPMRQIATNSGVDPGVVVDRTRSGRGTFGFDARERTYVDLFDAGIVDPTRVVRLALESAVSVSSTLLFADATLTVVTEAAQGAATPPNDLSL